MKTTIEIPDAIARQAGLLAAERQTTLRALVVQGLEYVLAEKQPTAKAREKSSSPPWTTPRASPRPNASTAPIPVRAEFFPDTNIPLYDASTAKSEQNQRDKARELLAMERGGLSVQVQAEFYVKATGKFHPPHERVVAILE